LSSSKWKEIRKSTVCYPKLKALADRYAEYIKNIKIKGGSNKSIMLEATNNEGSNVKGIVENTYSTKDVNKTPKEVQTEKDFIAAKAQTRKDMKKLKSNDGKLNGEIKITGLDDEFHPKDFFKAVEKEVVKDGNGRILFAETTKRKDIDLELGENELNYQLISCFTGWGTSSVKGINKYYSNAPNISLCKKMFPENSQYSVEK